MKPTPSYERRRIEDTKRRLLPQLTLFQRFLVRTLAHDLLGTSPVDEDEVAM